ncbi:hypothetical protein AWENTII_004672 [Aspergillus wentii]|nr:hypothetical protein MW887_009236 [Aspergillus wentii]
MSTPPSEMSWLKDQSPMSGTPGTPQGSRTTPEPGATSLVNPSSALLQDLLKEQRATRGSRGTASDDCDEYAPRTPDRCHSRANSQSKSLQHSHSRSQDDTSSEKKRKVNNALSSGLRQPREMGMREMDQYVSRINKQNFDLKLDIFHRMQQMATLEKKLERMEELEEEINRLHGLEDELQELRDAESDNQRLRESNEQLRQELDKRDHAVTEAVELICQLEARVEELETGGSSSRPSTACPDTSDGPAVNSPQLPATFDIPERNSSKRGTMLSQSRQVSSDSGYLQRAPSFLRDETKSTAVLRSLYPPNGNTARSSHSTMTKTESLHSMNEMTEAESPRLSALSECSDLEPHDSSVQHNTFDQLEIPLRNEDLASEISGLSEEQASKNDRIDQWIEPQPDVFSEPVSKRRNRASWNVIRMEDSSHERDFYMNGSLEKTRLRLDGVFGESRLPPTPDTMSTAYAVGRNGSDGSITTEKGRAEAMKRRLARPRSMDELTTRRGSANSLVTDSMHTNLSDTTRLGLGTNQRDDTPSIFPFNGLPLNANELLGQGAPDRIGFGYYGADTMLNGEAIRKVLSKMDKDHYSPPYAATGEEEPADTGSSSPPLTPQDWIEAGKSAPRSRKERYRSIDNDAIQRRTGATPTGRQAGARTPSQSSYLARRHSMDSTARESEVPNVPTLDLSSLDSISPPAIPRPPRQEPEPEPESRRRLSILPFFGRSLGNPRRLQPSPMPDPADADDGAPSPVIRKTRQIVNSKPSAPANGDLITTPTHGEANSGDNIHKTLPHSFTESNLSSQGTVARPSTSNSNPNNQKEHKRRGSLGIFGWMKGASGIGSSSKKQEPNSPTQPTAGTVREKQPSRLAYDNSGTAQAMNSSVTAMNANVEAFTSNAKQVSRFDDDDQGRRPRYMERRSRRAQ